MKLSFENFVKNVDSAFHICQVEDICLLDILTCHARNARKKETEACMRNKSSLLATSYCLSPSMFHVIFTI